MTWNWAIPVNTYFTEMPPTKSFSEKKIKNQFINGHINYNAKSLATLFQWLPNFDCILNALKNSDVAQPSGIILYILKGVFKTFCGWNNTSVELVLSSVFQIHHIIFLWGQSYHH